MRSRRRALTLVVAVALSAGAVSHSPADRAEWESESASAALPGVPSSAAAKIYLSQALASLARAEQLAQRARQYGPLEEFDLDRFLAELQRLAGGLERFVAPTGPSLGPAVPVEITGQYLYEGLQGRSVETPATLGQEEASR